MSVAAADGGALFAHRGFVLLWFARLAGVATIGASNPLGEFESGATAALR